MLLDISITQNFPYGGYWNVIVMGEAEELTLNKMSDHLCFAEIVKWKSKPK